MEKENNDQTYRGTAFADKVEKGVTYAATGLVNNLEKWSKPQEGIHDDVLRFGGKVFSHKLTQNVLKIAGAAGEAGGYVGSNAAKFLGVDPRIGGAIGSVVADAALGFGAGKVAKTAKLGQLVSAATKATKGPLDDALKISRQANRVPLRQTLRQGTDNLRQLAMSPQRQLAIAGGGGLKGRVDDFIPNKVFNFTDNEIKGFTKKLGSQESAKWGMGEIEKAHKYFGGKGDLKGFGSVRVDPKTGKSWLLKNKRSTVDTAAKGPRFGLDSLEKTNAGRMIREATAKVNEKDVWKWADSIKRKNPDITDGMIEQYIKAQRAHKRDLQKLIKNLNYDEGKGTWSLGHREAVDSFTKRGEVGADIIQNLELEPFRDMFDPKTGEWIRGNASRSAGDELERILLRASNQSTNIGEDILKFLDPDIGNFWPRMGKITNRKEWMKQTGLREQYYDNIKALAKKEGISLQEAADEYLLDIMSKTKRSQAPLFEQAVGGANATVQKGSGVLTNAAMDKTLKDLGISKEYLEGVSSSGFASEMTIRDLLKSAKKIR